MPSKIYLICCTWIFLIIQFRKELFGKLNKLYVIKINVFYWIYRSFSHPAIQVLIENSFRRTRKIDWLKVPSFRLLSKSDIKTIRYLVFLKKRDPKYSLENLLQSLGSFFKDINKYVQIRSTSTINDIYFNETGKK